MACAEASCGAAASVSRTAAAPVRIFVGMTNSLQRYEMMSSRAMAFCIGAPSDEIEMGRDTQFDNSTKSK
jgi:hypothetical protein